MRTDRLDGWKEIAGYIGRSVRTTQRWEQESALPVRRILMGGKPQVFAYAKELDRWRLQLESRTGARARLFTALRQAFRAILDGLPFRRSAAVRVALSEAETRVDH